ncbi:hypothetical protein ZWY2020_000614 [Hordeum vulgare]|nr:hypothetical protein ZWY2020_000614 [Hordeum vulgare]
MSRRRSRGGEKRMDAAIDHFAIMGYRSADVRSVVNRLLRDVYGKDGWPFLEDSCYHVVQEALFEMQEEQDKLQLQAVPPPQQQQQQEEEDGDGGGDDDHDDDEAQQQEAAMMEPPSENAMPIVMVDKLGRHIRHLQELVAQGVPAMDGSLNLRAIRTMKNILHVNGTRRMSQPCRWVQVKPLNRERGGADPRRKEAGELD